MKWRAFQIEGVTYDLTHLHPMRFEFVVPAKGEKPEQRYPIDVEFSMHCFTRGFAPREKVPAEWSYADNRETRMICLRRYELSKLLPEIVRSIGQRKCFHTGHGSFFTIEVLNDSGQREEYAVYFAVWKNGKGSGLRMFIKSAYILDGLPKPRFRKPCGFSVIAYNTKTGKPIKAPK